jgi:hypothetical protein
MVAPAHRSSRVPGFVPPAGAPRLPCPVSDAHIQYEVLCELHAHDGASDEDHAFLAYKETERATGQWRVRVRSLQTPGGVFEPATMALQAAMAGAQGWPYFVWGYQLAPHPGDSRQIEFRVHVRAGAPSQLELYVRLRRADGRPDLPRTAWCDWP